VLLEELNVKAVSFADHESGYATVKAKAAFARLGPRLGPKVKKAAAAIVKLASDDVETLAGGGSVTLTVDGEAMAIGPDDVMIEHVPHAGLVVAAEGGLVVVLETALTEALVQEGLAREFVNKVQNMRKTADLEVTQRIRLRFTGDEAVAGAVAQHRDYILAETLAGAIDRAAARPDGATDWDLNGHPCAIAFDPVAT
jgi:isoleucyl-tRNA synthetase